VNIEKTAQNNEILNDEILKLRREVKTLIELNAKQASEISRLHEIILGLKRQAFGSKKERWIDNNQLELGVFNEAEAEAKKAESEDDSLDSPDDQIQVKGFSRARGKRKPLPENLPREIVEVSLPESERFSADGQPLRVIGKEISEKLVYEPATMKVVEYHRLRYGVDSGQTIKTAPPVPMLIPKGIPTGSLIAAIVTGKYADGLPLYRMEEIFARQGVDIPRSSMGRWILQASEACMPIWNILQDRLLASPYVTCDETPTQVLKEKGRRAESKSWMWVRTNPSDDQKIALFDYDPHRSGAVALRLFTEYRGYLQVDGYGAYNALEKQTDVTRLGCNMHGRRGFEKADKEGAKSGKSLAQQGLAFYKQLYEIEERAKESLLDWQQRHKLRQEEAVPLWEKFRAWAEEHSKQVPPKSLIGEAFHYFINEYEYLTGYLLDGRLEMDNGFTERVIRKFAIGRNNWLFSDTEDGAHASAIFYSFVVTAKLNGVNPYLALRKIFEEIPFAKTLEDYERLANLLLYPANPA